jgi:hypothetical protein
MSLGMVEKNHKWKKKHNLEYDGDNPNANIKLKSSLNVIVALLSTKRYVIITPILGSSRPHLPGSSLHPESMVASRCL